MPRVNPRSAAVKVPKPLLTATPRPPRTDGPVDSWDAVMVVQVK